jgi:CBS domain-containing protein
MDNRSRTENGLTDNNRNRGPLSPTGTPAGQRPFIQEATPAEGEPGRRQRPNDRMSPNDRTPNDRTSTFRRWGQSTAGDSPSWDRSGYRRQTGFGGYEYGSDFDEREGWRERDMSAWPADEQNERGSYLRDRDPYRSGGDRGASFRERGGERDRERERDSYERGGRRSSWWQRESLTVTDVMTSNVKSVAPDATARDIAEIMKQEDVGVVPVVHPDGRLLGLVTDRDLVIRGLAGGHSLDNARAENLATTDIEVVSTRDPLSAVLDLMGRQQIRRVPVVDDDDRLVGIVAIADITRHADYHEDLQHALEKISGRRSFWSRIWR